ncbi:MAG: winged helix-turn-helix transcriptional regulator [Tissierellales bacterium]|nr:winged helix-turn-helix transcriptional regulator [Tissierellales bacterium]MBN2826783.1 winged helix-turn-helix transcriptional regulator [Tissierellales bacterium]
MNQLTNIFKLLSDSTRLRMLALLFQEDLCVCEISGILDVPQSRVSKNLSKLRDLNLVMDERKERFVFYSLLKEDVLLVQTLQYILDQKLLYPQIVEDCKRLTDKEKYLNQCCVLCD